MAHIDLHRPITSAGLEARGTALLGDLPAKKPAWLGGQISDYDSKFLAGLLNYSNARNAVEIGVASGWSSAVMLTAMAGRKPAFKMHGIDLSPTFYLDKSIRTGAAVGEVAPELACDFNLVAGEMGCAAMARVGKVDFAFIDGHHMHPWATIDLLSVLPFIEQGRWVAMHDLNLCTHERHKHTQRGPFYLFYMWPDQKLNSTQAPTMIGAVLLERKPEHYLPFLLELLYTPWELHLDAAIIDGFLASIEKNFGADWRVKFAAACARANLSA